MNVHELNRAISKKQFHNSYFLHGAESFLMEQAVTKLTDALVDPATKDFNFDVFYGGETEVGKIIDAANAYPMMAESRMVVVKDVDRLSSVGVESLSKYLEKPAPSTKLILLSARSDARGKGFKKIKSKSCSVECKPLYDRQIPAWVRDYLRDRGYKIEDEALMFVHSQAGNDLRTVVNELDKIILNLADRTTIQMEDAQSVVGLSNNFNPFELNDALGERDLHKSLRILGQMLETGESATVIVARISRHFGNLAKLKGAAARGKTNADMAALTGIPTFFISKTLRFAKNYTTEELERVFELLLETDLTLKTSQQPPLIALQGLVVQIVNNC